MKLRIFLLVSIVVAAACNGPTGLLPGGKLDGTTADGPTDWSFAGEYGTAQLETLPEAPYSVNLAYTVLANRLYVNAGGTETQWVKNMDANPLVRLRLDGELYDLRARRITDPQEIADFAEAWTSQSYFRRDPLDYEKVWIYELVRR